MINQYRITLVSFLAYFIMSGMLSPIGIISGPMAEHFGLPVTDITAKFSWLTLGILVGSALALQAFAWAKIKTLMLLVYSILTLCLLSMLILPGIELVGFALGLVGVGCGVGLAGAASIISSTYDENARASMLVITDGCFSVAGVICSYIAIYLVAQQFHWGGVYSFIGFIAVAIVGLALISKFPEYNTDLAESAEESAEAGAEETAGETAKPATGASSSAFSSTWPLSLWLCIGGLFLYTLGQYSLLWWLPNYAETSLNVPASQAGEMVGQFWSGMFFAQLFVAWWVFKVGVNKLVVLGAIATTLGSIPLWTVQDIDMLIILAFVWGFANLGLLKILISFGSLMVEHPSPRLISALLLGATTGTAISPIVTSQVVALSNSHVVLMFGTGCYLMLTVLVLLAGKLKPNVALS